MRFLYSRTKCIQAFELSKTAHESGCEGAAYLFGLSFRLGIGTQEERGKTKAVLQAAADKGDAFGDFELALMGHAERAAAAVQGLTPLAERGSPLAQFCLAWLCYHGLGA